jgi:hypothetical protein
MALVIGVRYGESGKNLDRLLTLRIFAEIIPQNLGLGAKNKFKVERQALVV